MAEDTPLRRTGRTRVRNKRYTFDTLKGSDFGDSSDDEQVGERVHETPDEANEDQDADDDFDGGEVVEEYGEDDEEVDEEDAELNEAAGASDEDSIQTGDEDADLANAEPTIDINGRKVSVSRDVLSRNGDTTWRWAQMSQPPDNSTRGIWNRVTHTHRYHLFREAFGAEEDFGINLSADHFTFDPTLPSRRTGFAYPPGYVDGIECSSKIEPKAWFPVLEGHWQQYLCLRKGLDNEAGQRYLPRSCSMTEILAGPYPQQERLQLNNRQPFRLNTLFRPSQPEDNPKTASKNPSRESWIIDVGGRIQAISWCPARAGEPQYLAVAVEQRKPDKNPTPFVPSEHYPASIQIWRFTAVTDADDADMSPSQTATPALIRVICAEWGGVRKLQWCPGILDTADMEGQAGDTIGLLATLWTDGSARVLEVDTPPSGGSIFSLYRMAPFSVRPPETVCTCLTWINSEDLAVGCANGYIAVWNVARAVQHVKMGEDELVKDFKPWLYHAVHDTYIMDIISMGPVAPNLVHTLSISGYQQLTDLRHPELESTATLRTRMYQSSAAYCPHLQASVSTDENGDLVAYIHRRFFHARRIAPTTAGPSGGSVMASSPLHCSVLFGTPDGTVSCTNPLQRLVVPKAKTSWVQKWFVHEWRELKLDPNGTDQTNDQASRRGVVRMTEGYRLEKVPTKYKAKDTKDRMVQTAFVFEEEQAITAIVWNPNVEYASWAAVGTGSGMLRIEDLGV